MVTGGILMTNFERYKRDLDITNLAEDIKEEYYYKCDYCVHKEENADWQCVRAMVITGCQEGIITWLNQESEDDEKNFFGE